MAASHEASKRFECVVVRAATRAPSKEWSRVEPGEPSLRDVVQEQPLRIDVNGEPVATLMRTPGAEIELATGFLLTEGVIRSRSQIMAMSFCPDTPRVGAGVVRVCLVEKPDQQTQRRYRDVFSSCGLCGTEVLDAFAEGCVRFEKPAGRLRGDDVFRLRDAMEAAQDAFHLTGGTHAAALAELPFGTGMETPPRNDAAGAHVVVREDLGRHNALDKAVGAAVASDFALTRSLLFLSGRLSFEMVAKAARAGISDLAAVSAPSTLGVELARKLGMFLAAFVRGDTMTVYAGAEALAPREGA